VPKMDCDFVLVL